MSRLVLAAVLAVMWMSSVQDHGPSQFTLRGSDFEVTRRVTPAGRVEIIVYGGGELIPLTVRIGGHDDLVVSRAANAVWALSDPEKVMALAGGRAVTAFREHVGEHERRLIAAGPSPATADDPEALGFLLTGGLLASFGGDPVAGPRARDLVIRALQAAESPPGAPAAACWARWRVHLRRADDARSVCLADAARRDGWTERRALRTLCEAAFVAEFTLGESALAACKRSDQF